MRVVIVGGAGFIGCALATHLSGHGYGVHILDSARRLERSTELLHGISQTPFDFRRDELCAVPRIAEASCLVHLGCTTNPATSMEMLRYDAESNIGPSIRLFDAASRAGIGRIVFASSGGTVYGAPERLPACESDAVRPLSGYGVSKLAIEGYLSLYRAMNPVSLRIANPYGVYQFRGAPVGVIARYMRAIETGNPIEVWGDGTVVRDYLTINDVVEAFRAALSSELPPGAYNLGSGEGTDLNQVIEMLFDATGKRVPVRYLDKRPYDVPAIVLDSSRLRAYTGWMPKRRLREGIGDLWEARLAQLNGCDVIP